MCLSLDILTILATPLFVGLYNSLYHLFPCHLLLLSNFFNFPSSDPMINVHLYLTLETIKIPKNCRVSMPKVSCRYYGAAYLANSMRSLQNISIGFRRSYSIRKLGMLCMKRDHFSLLLSFFIY